MVQDVVHEPHVAAKVLQVNDIRGLKCRKPDWTQQHEAVNRKAMSISSSRSLMTPDLGLEQKYASPPKLRSCVTHIEHLQNIGFVLLQLVSDVYYEKNKSAILWHKNRSTSTAHHKTFAQKLRRYKCARLQVGKLTSHVESFHYAVSFKIQRWRLNTRDVPLAGVPVLHRLL